MWWHRNWTYLFHVCWWTWRSFVFNKLLDICVGHTVWASKGAERRGEAGRKSHKLPLDPFLFHKHLSSLYMSTMEGPFPIPLTPLVAKYYQKGYFLTLPFYNIFTRPLSGVESISGSSVYLSIYLSVITSYLTEISVSFDQIKKIEKQGAFVSNFASGRSLPTQSTGPQTPFFTDISVSVAQIKKI